ncbi:hypothetical protein Ahy_A03g016310 [Arachis hypogaea]|uniref:Uncharacterized protein n=1 Tax=Arachis hypogaea TaxID=3818 RepID=A0A445E2U3_ARAHY|nr:hypothetical protein Ahy_A03g016310 [Arachis hypogaea]
MMRPDPAIWWKIRYPSLFWLPSRAYSNGLPRSNEAVGISNSGLETCIKEIHEKFDELSILEELRNEERQWLEYCGRKNKMNYWLKKVEGLKEEAAQILLHQDALQDPQKEIDDLESKLTKLYREMLRYMDFSCANQETVQKVLDIVKKQLALPEGSSVTGESKIEVLQLNMANVLLEKGIDLNAEDEEGYANIMHKYVKNS